MKCQSCVITSSENESVCGPWRCTSAGFTCFSVFLQTLHHIRDLFGLNVCVYVIASAAIVCQKYAKCPDLCGVV